MTELGTIAVYNESDSNIYNLTIMNLNMPDGWAWDIPQRLIAPITGMGVDWTRMRLVRNDAPRFRMQIYSDFATFDDAVSAGKAMMGYKGYRCMPSFTAATVEYTFDDYAYIWEVSCKPMPCQLVSTVGSNDAQALLYTELLLQFTEVGS